MAAKPGSTECARPASVPAHLARACGCRASQGAGKVDGMNSAPTPALSALLTPFRRLASRRTATPQTLAATLTPADPVRALDCATGCRATLQVLAGRAWITQHGDGDDWFLEAGQQLALSGPGRLYAGAEGGLPLRLRWMVEPAPPRDGTACTVRTAA